MGEPWVVRDAVPEDEACLASMWLAGYARSREHGHDGAGKKGSPEQIQYWRVHQPIVTSLLRSCRVRVLCDAERVTYRPGSHAVIWAWSCSDGDYLHWVGIKSRMVQTADDAAGFFEDVVPEELRASRMRTTFDLVDLVGRGLVPSHWTRDRSWLPALRKLSERMLQPDLGRFAKVAASVLDVTRTPWEPSPTKEAA